MESITLSNHIPSLLFRTLYVGQPPPPPSPPPSPPPIPPDVLNLKMATTLYAETLNGLQ
jgi:hypothetical protein